MNSNLWNKLYPNFKKSEFHCPCGCCQEPEMDEKLMDILQAIRNKYGQVDIKCGYRCKKQNDILKGSIPNSDHLYFRAADIQVKGMTSLNQRKEIMLYASNFVGYKYSYCDGWINKKDGTNKAYYASNMGLSIHISVED